MGNGTVVFGAGYGPVAVPRLYGSATVPRWVLVIRVGSVASIISRG